jgi:hypothetical protein
MLPGTGPSEGFWGALAFPGEGRLRSVQVPVKNATFDWNFKGKMICMASHPLKVGS